jgi:HemY protein
MIRAAFIFLTFVLLLLAVLAAARFDRGYVLIVFPPWRVEMSFILAIALTFCLYVLTYVAFKLLRVALRLPAEVRARRERRLRERAADDLSRAVAALISGQEAHARKLAEASLRRQRNPLAVLVAARSALEQGDAAGARAHAESITASDVGELIAARQAVMARLEAQPADAAALPGAPQEARN